MKCRLQAMPLKKARAAGAAFGNYCRFGSGPSSIALIWIAT